MKQTNNKLRVIHYPNIPCEFFFVEVKDEDEALLIKETLADQHLFLFDNGFIPDYTNHISVQMMNNGVWVEYCNEFSELEFDDFIENQND